MVHITLKTQGKAFTAVFEYVLSACLLIWKLLPIRTFAQICVFYLRLPFSAWCPHILTKSVASSYRFVYVCTTFYWTSGTKGLSFKHLHHLPFCYSRTFVKKTRLQYICEHIMYKCRLQYDEYFTSFSYFQRQSSGEVLWKCVLRNFTKFTGKHLCQRLKRENSKFKILNFTNYEKFYFHCLANAKLKPHTKVLKNLFHNMVLKNLCVTTISPSYFSSRET